MLYSLFWRTISHSGAVMDSVLRLTNVVFWGFSWDLCIWMNSCSIFSAKVGISWSIHLENVAEIGIKFRFDTFPYKIANVLQLRDFARFSDACDHIFYFSIRWSDNLSEIVIGVDVGEVIDLAKRCQAIGHIKGKLTEDLSVIGLNFFSFRDFPDECPSNDAWLAKVFL